MKHRELLLVAQGLVRPVLHLNESQKCAIGQMLLSIRLRHLAMAMAVARSLSTTCYCMTFRRQTRLFAFTDLVPDSWVAQIGSTVAGSFIIDTTLRV